MYKLLSESGKCKNHCQVYKIFHKLPFNIQTHGRAFIFALYCQIVSNFFCLTTWCIFKWFLWLLQWPISTTKLKIRFMFKMFAGFRAIIELDTVPYNANSRTVSILSTYLFWIIFVLMDFSSLQIRRIFIFLNSNNYYVGIKQTQLSLNKYIYLHNNFKWMSVDVSELLYVIDKVFKY